MELLRDRSPELEEAGVQAFGISRDSPWSHIAWQQALDLTVPLLSDWNGEATRGFALAREYRGMAEVPARAAFVVDPDGTIVFARGYDDSEVPDLDELVAAARG